MSLPSGLWHAGQRFILASSIRHEQDTPELPCFLTSGPWLTLGFIQNAHPVPMPHAHPMLSAASSRSTSMNTRRAPCPVLTLRASAEAGGCLTAYVRHHPNSPRTGSSWRCGEGGPAPRPCPHLFGTQGHEVWPCTRTRQGWSGAGAAAGGCPLSLPLDDAQDVGGDSLKRSCSCFTLSGCLSLRLPRPARPCLWYF